MKILKKIFAALIIISVLPGTLNLTSCLNTEAGKTGKLKIIATLFPQYDFAKQITGDKADVVLLLPPGMESHSFDPKPGDMLEIYKADLFLYTGKYMEPWAETIAKGAANENLAVVDCSENIKLIEHEAHDHGPDPHIWLNPENAVTMLKNIYDRIIITDPDNTEYYKKNMLEYEEKLNEMNKNFSDAVENSERGTIVFGGRFAYMYFLDYYKLDYVTAYNSCSILAEPGASQIAYVVRFIKQNNIPCIYHEELSDSKVAKTISENTGAEFLQFSTAHNVTQEEFDGGITFLDIMYKNLENLKRGLS